MTIGAQLNCIKAKIDAWAKDSGATVQIAADLIDLFSMLAVTPGKVRVLIMFHGERKRGEFEESSMVDRTFWVSVGKGRSMSLKRGDDLVAPAAGGPPLFDVVEQVRQQLRDLDFDGQTTEEHINYRDCSPFNLEGYLVDAFNLEFSIGDVMPPPNQTEDTP